jgi:HTH-type transcriptional regulator/antitoxin HipB
MDYLVSTPAQLAAQLRSLRRMRQLTQAQLGAKAGLSQTRIGKIERDPRHVSTGQLMRILALLGARLVLHVPAAGGAAAARRPAETADW